MKIKDDANIMKYVTEYLGYCMQERFFDGRRASELYEKLRNIGLEYVPANFPGDASFENGVLKINTARTFSNERQASLVLFHEFTHICSTLHEDMYSRNSMLKRFSDYMAERTDTNYQFGNQITKRLDVNNPYTYSLWGALLIDEVTAENVAYQLISRKYGIDRNAQTKSVTRRLGHLSISYRTNMGYYGIGQEIVDKFAKTLFLKTSDKNLNGLSKEIFQPDFVKCLIWQHNERPYAMECLFKELSYMGVIAFYEEFRNGHMPPNKKAIAEYLVYDSYKKVFPLLDCGREGRETIPQYISAPEFF